ncbi:3-deoxy-D-arabino-heptulosonate 7-phosphate (DAHP) synthase [Dysgonomonas sp. PH5-45]|uniref:hypothetical protein n=1 Tax=unclassified Dysgonomonas TaxID=2630389 RepID=UPI002473ADB6|nr:MULTISPECIES: hypothetical protein [unclassified Dysgonomonas]MDH6353688.1 3-deoxy-D-arabino-heptulosonate 7-phosphate (DAHP) synthase [Dysgonomonas sp. PH5-45]MDH6386591.1 3-deoxy-D-arabino-heptulosonate 7-phosphate (DAHP) synthase [Dysgonomonas sp. PH5-37]
MTRALRGVGQGREALRIPKLADDTLATNIDMLRVVATGAYNISTFLILKIAGQTRKPTPLFNLLIC